MAPAHFLSLPTEVMILVMREVGSFQDVIRLSQTCRYFHRVWAAHTRPIIEHSVRASIPSENQVDAFAACRAARISRLWAHKSPDFDKKQVRFIQEYVRGRRDGANYLAAPLIDLQEWISVRQLADLTDEFILEFKAQARISVAVRLEQDPILTSSDKELSWSERIRLQRAFFRLEIYRRLFPNNYSHEPLALHGHLQRHNRPAGFYAGTSSHINTDYSEYQTDNFLFLGIYAPWEIEELLAAYEFLFRSISSIHLPFYDCETWGINLLGTPHRGQLAAESPESLFESTYSQIFWHTLRGRGLKFVVGKGLPFIRWIKNLAPSKQFYVVLKIDSYSYEMDRHDRISSYGDTSELRLELDLETYDEQSALPSNRVNSCLLENPNPGWYWVETKTRSYTGGVRGRYYFREMGCIFWDQTRLEEHWKNYDIDRAYLLLDALSVVDCTEVRNLSEHPLCRNYSISLPVETLLPAHQRLDPVSQMPSYDTFGPLAPLRHLEY